MTESLAYLLLCSFTTGVIGAILGAWVCARRLRLQLDPKSSAVLAGLQSSLAQLVRQAIQLELEFLARQQAERDEARAKEQRHWQAAQEGQRAEEMALLLRVLEARTARPALQARSDEPRHEPPATTPATMQTPEEVERELSDEELDALPPELPAPGKPRRRAAVAPKAPVLRKL